MLRSLLRSFCRGRSLRYPSRGYREAFRGYSWYVGLDSSTTSVSPVAWNPWTNQWVSAPSVPKPAWQEGPSGEVTTNPSEWEPALLQAIRNINGVIPGDGVLMAFGIDAEQHTCYFESGSGKPNSSAWTWADARAADMLDEISREIGWKPPAGLLLPKLYFAVRRCGSIFSTSERVVVAAAAATRALTGNLEWSASEAAANGIGLDRNTWEFDPAHLALVSERLQGMLPTVVEPGKFASGSVTQDVVDALDFGMARLTTGTRVTPGLADNAATAIAAGLKPGRLILTGGTSWCGIGHRGSLQLDPEGIVLPFLTADGEEQPLVCMVNGGGRIDDLVDQFNESEFGRPMRDAERDTWRGQRYFELEQQLVDGEAVGDVPPGCGDEATCLFFTVPERLPMIRPSGDRIEFYGLTPEQECNRAFMYRLLLECQLYNLADGIEHMKSLGVSFSEIVVAGGVARSLTWCQMIADILGVPVRVLKDPQMLAPKGAAIYAAWCEARASGYMDLPLHQLAEYAIDFGDTVLRPRARYKAALRKGMLRFLAKRREVCGV